MYNIPHTPHSYIKVMSLPRPRPSASCLGARAAFPWRCRWRPHRRFLRHFSVRLAIRSAWSSTAPTPPTWKSATGYFSRMRVPKPSRARRTSTASLLRPWPRQDHPRAEQKLHGDNRGRGAIGDQARQAVHESEEGLVDQHTSRGTTKRHKKKQEAKAIWGGIFSFVRESSRSVVRKSLCLLILT